MRVLWVTLIIIVTDQLTKVLIKGSEMFGIKGMQLGDSVPVLGQWFRLTFTENPGMAFGIEVGSKLFLTLFALVATVLIFIYILRMKKGHWGYRLSLAAILGGAVGNLIDRTFYGVWYGYGTLFHGNVVDFIHFDVWRGIVPDWIPLIGGQWMALLPIWNVADMAIVVGVTAILIFQGRFHRYEVARQLAEKSPNADPEPDTIAGKDHIAPMIETIEKTKDISKPDAAA